MNSVAPEWTARDLNDRVERGDRFVILDVRNRDEFERSRIEGRVPIPTTNVPYFEMLEALMDLARELGVNVVACDMSQGVMGIKDNELMSGLDHGGVGTFLGSALRSRVAMFI